MENENIWHVHSASFHKAPPPVQPLGGTPKACWKCLNNYCGAAHSQGQKECNDCCAAHMAPLGSKACGKHNCPAQCMTFCQSAPVHSRHPAPHSHHPASWPTFSSAAELEANAWGTYYKTVYGQLSQLQTYQKGHHQRPPHRR